MFKQIFRKLLDRELGVLGADFEKLDRKMEDLGIQLDALKLRFDRLQNRTGMRLSRAEMRMTEQRPAIDPRQGYPVEWSDEDIMADIEMRRRGGH